MQNRDSKIKGYILCSLLIGIIWLLFFNKSETKIDIDKIPIRFHGVYNLDDWDIYISDSNIKICEIPPNQSNCFQHNVDYLCQINSANYLTIKNYSKGQLNGKSYELENWYLQYNKKHKKLRFCDSPEMGCYEFSFEERVSN